LFVLYKYMHIYLCGILTIYVFVFRHRRHTCACVTLAFTSAGRGRRARELKVQSVKCKVVVSLRDGFLILTTNEHEFAQFFRQVQADNLNFQSAQVPAGGFISAIDTIAYKATRTMMSSH